MAEGIRILLIEDDPIHLRLERDLLEVAGYVVFLAGNAAQGLALAAEKRPELILLDYRLPGVNGMNLREILLRDGNTKDIPIVFITASATVEEKEKLAATGCPVITKPINTRTFASEIAGMLEDHGKNTLR